MSALDLWGEVATVAAAAGSHEQRRRLVWCRGQFLPEDEALETLRAWIETGRAASEATEEELAGLELLRQLLHHPEVAMWKVRAFLDAYHAHGFERRRLADRVGAFLDGKVK